MEAPRNYQGICNMVKLKTQGWRNVSTWGLFGLPLLTAAISLASVEASNQDLWLVMAFRGVFNLFHLCFVQV